MAKLKVQNVGPIKEGFEDADGFIDIRGVTVFIGNQGSGKSTVAKLFSSLCWVEKALVRGDFTDKYVMQYRRFKKHLEYQNLGNYLNDTSYIEYLGDAYHLTYSHGQFNVTANDDRKNFSFPKIMYVPAERNFVSSVDRPDLVKRLPLPLYTFMDEYESAKQALNNIEELPVGNVSFEYKKHSKKSFLVGRDYELELLEASSGFQSLVPLVLVTRYLSEVIKNKTSETRKEINRDEEEKIRKAVAKAIENKKISEDVLTAVFEQLSAKFRYESFINIVEEPEQNLFPDSQNKILYELLKYKNENANNKLLITTHSPYLINYLTLAVQGKHLIEIMQSMENIPGEQLLKLKNIVPETSLIAANDVITYQLSDGKIKLLPSPNGFPSSKNYLNLSIAEGNYLFDQMLAIEQE